MTYVKELMAGKDYKKRGRGPDKKKRKPKNSAKFDIEATQKDNPYFQKITKEQAGARPQPYK
jgi:hypothetical protein